MNKLFHPSLFAGKVNIITGGGTGIGYGVAKAIVELGGKCVIASRSRDKINSAVDELQRHCSDGAEVLGLTVNIRDRHSVEEMVKQTLENFGRIDGLVNNGGGQFSSPAAAISPNGWNAVVETNLHGTWFCMQEVFDQWMKTHGGYIVNIVTTNRLGMVGMCHSGAARAGVKSLSQSIGSEWIKYGVKINNIAPGVIYSDTAQANYGPVGELLFSISRNQIPAGELGRVDEDCVPPIIFMLTPGVQYTTGQTLDVCGGLSLYNNYMVEFNERTASQKEVVDQN